ncbi:30S ribosomal protein S20 [bacterium]|nr:30S ribosomal protein S20 [bacterium]
MPHHKSAWKRMKTSKKQNLANRSNRSTLKNAVKNVLVCTEKAQAQEAYNRASQLLDHFEGKNLVHKNKVANQKSRLAKFINSLSKAE